MYLVHKNECHIYMLLILVYIFVLGGDINFKFLYSFLEDTPINVKLLTFGENGRKLPITAKNGQKLLKTAKTAEKAICVNYFVLD